MFNKFITIVFLFLYSAVIAQKDFKILSSSESQLIVEYTPIYTDTAKIKSNSTNYLSISFFDGHTNFSEKIGTPQVQFRKFNIGVPDELGNNIRVLSSKYSTIDGKIIPTPNMKKENGFPSYEYAESSEYNNFSNPELVTFGDYGLVRDLSIQTLNVFPIQFDVNENKIRLYSKIVFQVTFGKSRTQNSVESSELISDAVINFKTAKQWGAKSKTLKKGIRNSVLATGDWFKFEAPQEGIYKIDKSYLSSIGIDVNSVDPRTIKIYNNGGYILPWGVDDERPIDLVENAILVNGETDGKFDDGDNILFYGRGVDFFEFNSKQKKILRNKNWYSKQNYYWLTFGGTNGKRMSTQQSDSAPADFTQTFTDAFKFIDDDKQNLIGSGLINVGDDFTSSKRSVTYSNMLSELIDGSEIDYSFAFVNGSGNSNSLSIDENGTRIFSGSVRGESFYSYGGRLVKSIKYTGNLPDKRSVLKFTYNPTGISDKGHLDFLEIKYKKSLSATDNNLGFYSGQDIGKIEYNIKGFSSSDITVLNISDYSNVAVLNTSINGGQFTFKANEIDTLRSKYISLTSDQFKEPTKAIKIENSNIRGITRGTKYIILTHKNFKDHAERLVNYRSSEAQFKAISQFIVIDDLYNEFSCGSLDPTVIRDFLKYAYDNWDIKPEYVLLFGDGDFDYYDLLGKGLNFIPTFQKKESLKELKSYPYDDFYSRISGSDKKADIAIGRLNVTTTDEARIVVDKIIKYETKIDKGLWRNTITLLADDGLTSHGDDGNTHTRQSETLSKSHIPASFQKNKIYLSNYKTAQTGLGRRKPDVNNAIIDAMNNGTLIFNYIGHGNPDVWAHEGVFERSISIPQLRNDRYFFLTAATCDFGKYDDPNLQSATEEMILMENAGMIGALSAVRPVYSNSNADLNENFYGHLFGEKDSLGFSPPIGNVYFKMKRDRTNENDEKFHLFGDPLVRLNIPKLPVTIESVNNNNLNQDVQIKALSQVTIKGKVRNGDNTISQFSGEGIVTVFDSKREVHLDDINYDMEVQDAVIFRGRVSIENGEFATSFTVPKDISYENKNGKIVAYIFNDEFDGVGSTSNIIVGGTDTTNINDKKGPEIEILYDEEEIQSSYLVSPNFKLRVKLFDKTGLNTTGTGIGHKLEAILNDDKQNSIDLTNYFVGELNSGGKSGEVNYIFSSLKPDEYKIKIKAWDVFNNFSSSESFFTVVDDSKLIVREVYNYPNPFSSNTYFTFQHNLTNEVN
ncbi:MAG: type IX secretion system sortase PorU, partial [Melioribacteraceae bacterium]